MYILIIYLQVFYSIQIPDEINWQVALRISIYLVMQTDLGCKLMFLRSVSLQYLEMELDKYLLFL